MTALRLDLADLADFAAATGDRNPLHLDAEFARRSTFGQPIAHGVLAAAATLAIAGVELDGVTRLAVAFDLPVLPGLTYRAQAEADRATLRLGESRVLTIRWEAARTPVPEHPLPQTGAGCPPAGRARVLTGSRLAALPAEAGTYRPDLPGLHRLLRRITGSSIPGRLAEPLAWASFFTGMRTPGRDALLASVLLWLADDEAEQANPASYQVRAPRFDERTGLVTLDARLTGRSAVRLAISAFLRHRVELPGFAETTGALPRSERLAGRTVLVVGGSRGIGAALAYCLAGQAAQVLAVSSRPAPPECARLARAERLAIEWACCDAGDADGLRAVVAGTKLGGLVLAAGPRVVGLPLSPEAVPPCVAHVSEAVRLAITPLAVTAPNLRDDPFVLFVSSAAMTTSEFLWPHYVAAKAALEGLAAYAARHHPAWRVVVARPPRMRTEMANGPASSLGALPPSEAAARIVARLLSVPPAPGAVQLIDGAAFPGTTAARTR